MCRLLNITPNLFGQILENFEVHYIIDDASPYTRHMYCHIDIQHIAATRYSSTNPLVIKSTGEYPILDTDVGYLEQMNAYEG